MFHNLTFMVGVGVSQDKSRFWIVLDVKIRRNSTEKETIEELIKELAPNVNNSFCLAPPPSFDEMI